MDALESFAATLRRLRLERGLTHEQLADRSGVELAGIGRIERGERDPGVRTVARLARGLGVRPAELFEDVE